MMNLSIYIIPLNSTTIMRGRQGLLIGYQMTGQSDEILPVLIFILNKCYSSVSSNKMQNPESLVF